MSLTEGKEGKEESVSRQPSKVNPRPKIREPAFLFLMEVSVPLRVNGL